MAATLTAVTGGGDVWGKHRVDLRDITGDNNYPAGGYALTGALFGLRSIVGMMPAGGITAADGIAPFWNTATNKLMFIYPTQTATSPNKGGDAPPGTDFSATTFRMLVISLDS